MTARGSVFGFATGLVLGLALGTGVAGAGVCTVPGSHSTVQAAVDDPGCAEIQLAAAAFDESVHIPRTLVLSGPVGGGALLAGRLTALGAGTVVDLVDLAVENGCEPQALSSLQGARIEGLGLDVHRQAGLPCPVQGIFSDGFESGDTSAWDNTVQ